MAGPEAKGNESRNINSDYEKWKTLEQRRFSSPAEFSVNEDGDVVFSKFRDTIVFGETPHAPRVALHPGETTKGGGSYYDTVIKIETSNGGIYYINQGIFLDVKNAQYVDVAASKGEDYDFPNITIGYRLPLEKISRNLSQSQTAYAMKVSFLGEEERSSLYHEEKEHIADYIASIRRQRKKQ